MKLTFVLVQRDFYKYPNVAMMRGAAACVVVASESRIVGRYAIVIPSPEKEPSP